MKYLKYFESKSKSDIETDVAGILVELFDLGLDPEISWLDNHSFNIKVVMDSSRIDKNFKTDDLIHIINGFENYINLIWNNPFISYTIDGLRFQRIPNGYNIDNLEINTQKRWFKISKNTDWI